jgi:hypothetical protein
LHNNIWQTLNLNTKLFTEPQPDRVAELEAKLQIAVKAINYAKNNVSWADGKRSYHEDIAYYSEALKQIGEL